jgi:tripartite-type tricarboxylate transporter receptor subunit TctC
MNSVMKRMSAIAAAAVCLHAAPALAADYPDRPVRVIVPFGPSGGTDVLARAIAQQLLASTGKTMVVENRAGAGGLIGAQLVVDADPDGYTVLFTTASLAVNTTLYAKRMKFNSVKDLAPVGWIASAPLVLVVHTTVPAKNVRELIALEKKSPGFITAGVNSVGTTSHLAAEMLKQFAGVDHVIVPYKGGGPAMIGLMSGETDFLFATAPAAAPHIKSGRVRALAVTTEKPASVFPDLPTMNAMFPGFVSDNWYALFVRAGTPQNIIAWLNSEVLKTLKAPTVATFMKEEGLDPVGSTPAELAALMKREIAKYAKVIKQAKIKM